LLKYLKAVQFLDSFYFLCCMVRECEPVTKIPDVVLLVSQSLGI